MDRQEFANSKTLKKKRRRMGKKIRFPIMVSLIPEPSKYNNMFTFRLRYRDTKTGKIITELGKKLSFRAYGDSSDDIQSWLKAEEEKVQAQAEINKTGYIPKGTVIDFFTLFEDVAEEHDKETTKNNYLDSLRLWFRTFIEKEYGLTEKLAFAFIEDGSLLKKYRKHLLQNCDSQNSAGFHMRLVNHVKEVAWQKRFIQQNIKIPTIRQVEVDKDVLSVLEIEKIFATPSENRDVKRAFLFSCLSGLAKKDLLRLTWGEIIFEDDSILLTTKRSKTGILVRNHLNPMAGEILDKPGKKTDLVFPALPKHSYLYQLHKWVKLAGITKKIGTHSGRHTYAALFKDSSDDIKALSKALGHASINTTSLAYSHVNDKQMKKDTSLEGINFKIPVQNTITIQPGNAV